jgi:type IV secretion system protein VirD4
MASTRSGKGVSLIIPHLLRYKGSAFVLDPKGENAKATGRRRKELNDTVFYLDPFGISGKPQARFNPLSRFTPENMEAESKALAAALSMGDFGKRDHWTASGQQLLAALILYVYASPDIPKKEKDLGTVRRLLLGSCSETLEAMRDTDLADGLVSDLAASFLQTPPTERGNIISTAQRETEILDNPFIIKCLSASGNGNEVDFKAWRNGTMTVFLCLSAPRFPVFSRWLRLVLASALDEMTDTLNPPSLPVCFMLDELATLGHLQAVENAVGLAAGYGVQLWAVFQDVAQMKDLYKGRWASFVGNAGVRAVFSLQDYDTAKYWSDFLGHRVVETRSQSQNIYGITHGQNVGETLRPLLSPEEIMMQFANKRRANGHCPEPENMLVLAQGSCPLITKRVAYFDDRALQGLWDDPRIPTFNPSDGQTNWEEKIICLWISKRDDLKGFWDILNKSGILLGNMNDNGDWAFITKDLKALFPLRKGKGANQINNDIIEEMTAVFDRNYTRAQPKQEPKVVNDNFEFSNDNEPPSFDEFRKRNKKKKK